jgi:hypothetical protein
MHAVPYPLPVQALVRERNLLHASHHVKARTKHPAYPLRYEVPDDKVRRVV